MKYLFGFLVTVGLIVLLIILLATGGSSKTTLPNTSKLLTTYSNDPTALVRLTVDSPITAPQNHHAARITVSRDNTTFEQLVGYNGQITSTQSYPNTQTSYVTFLRAIEDRKSTRLNSSHVLRSRMPSSA